MHIFFQKQTYFPSKNVGATHNISGQNGKFPFTSYCKYEQTNLTMSHAHCLSLSNQRIPSWDAVMELALL